MTVNARFDGAVRCGPPTNEQAIIDFNRHAELAEERGDHFTAQLWRRLAKREADALRKRTRQH